MQRVVHVVVTSRLAGVERYVANTASELADRDWEVLVIGGDPRRMPQALAADVRWLPGATPIQAFRSLARIGRQDICHVHMTFAEAVGVAGRPLHRAPIVSTRHFAAARGSSPVVRALSPLISAQLAREIAVSRFVASRMERSPDAVLLNGVPPTPCLWRASSRVVLVLQRLEPEKDTLTALRAWQASRLWEDGWSLRVVGDGSERPMLEAWAQSQRIDAVTFAGWADDAEGELARAGVLLAPAPSDSVGLAVLEAMAAGVPVAASKGGGHLETAGRVREAPSFAAGDADEAATVLRLLLADAVRQRISAASRELVATDFSIDRHVDGLLTEYEAAHHETMSSRRRRRETCELRELVVCSLEAWDEVWRRNQFFTDILLRRNPGLRVLFVEPAADPLFEVSKGRQPALPRLRSISPDGRLLAFRPLKALPRRAGPLADRLLQDQVRSAARFLGFSRPTLWINDVTYAPLIRRTGWPSLYDVTDDWLFAPAPARELERLRRLNTLAVETADEVVACSQALAKSRGAKRRVWLIPNAVDVDHFRRPKPRPADLPNAPVAVYVGSLHESRLDVDLTVELARSLPCIQVALVGPDSLDGRLRARLTAERNIHLLGARPNAAVPGYLQHADVIVVPHLVNEFTESLDPIKAYECAVTSTPTVATPVAGFRTLDRGVIVAPRDAFPAAVRTALSERKRDVTIVVSSWEDRVEEFRRVLERVAASTERSDVA
jgi:glycosyltransferase involved in cell wall biosynthesis